MKTILSAVIASLAMLVAQSASATLIAGANSVTDTQTNLEWLKLTPTIGLSYNSVLASDYVKTQGYTYATAAQLTALFQDAGGVAESVCCTFSSSRAAVSNFITIFGGATSTAIGYAPLWSAAMWGNQNIALMDIEMSNAGAMALKWETFSANTVYRSDVASFLVRTQQASSAAVPEPASLALFGLGALGFGAIRRRKMKSA